jgi:hypothetical protein
MLDEEEEGEKGSMRSTLLLARVRWRFVVRRSEEVVRECVVVEAPKMDVMEE